MTEAQALDFVTRVPWEGNEPGLLRIGELLKRLGNPHEEIRSIHIAGSNGKGSVACMLASVLREAGLTTGLFVSPHLVNYRERIQLDGEMIPSADFIAMAEEIEPAVRDMEEEGIVPTLFERVTAMGLLYFKKKRCDIAVIETGLGGRLDCTNIIENPIACVITSLSLEHKELLGSTLGEIAREKAGIIKKGSPVITCSQEAEAQEVIEEEAAKKCCSLYISDGRYLEAKGADLTGQYLQIADRGLPEGLKGLAGMRMRMGLMGVCQYKNTGLVMDTLAVMAEQGFFSEGDHKDGISPQAIKRGIERAFWPGRFQLLAKGDIPIVLDGAHNPQGTLELYRSLRYILEGYHFVFVMGIMRDKDRQEMIEITAPLALGYVTVRPDSGRALEAEALSEQIREVLPGPDLPVLQGGSPAQAIALAKKLAEASPPEVKSGVCIFGSLYLAGEVLAALDRGSVDV